MVPIPPQSLESGVCVEEFTRKGPNGECFNHRAQQKSGNKRHSLSPVNAALSLFLSLSYSLSLSLTVKLAIMQPIS